MPRPKKNKSKKYTAVLPPIRCSASDKAIIRSKAKSAGLSMSEYARQTLSGEQVIFSNDNANPSFELPLIHHLKSDIGSRLNKMTHRANMTGELPIRLKDCLRDLLPVLDYVLMSLRLYDNYLGSGAGKSLRDDFNADLIYQIQRIDTNLVQLSNIASIRDMTIKELSLCLQKTEILLDRFIYTQSFSE